MDSSPSGLAEKTQPPSLAAVFNSEDRAQSYTSQLFTLGISTCRKWKHIEASHKNKGKCYRFCSRHQKYSSFVCTEQVGICNVQHRDFIPHRFPTWKTSALLQVNPSMLAIQTQLCVRIIPAITV